ncbi:hypothetical protein Bpfe_008268 [Biomphalaria pfeifferi]|uniref:Uncharacterized protein n=1 Tax=Biomphalaria pfeifferi TaxID=112525 RepID=A0AAD8BY14_BIOPF|nr:hypothetical protein Bpfe_008268 [Biomphalaria pfeifferi]
MLFGQDYTTPCLQILNTIIDNVHKEKIVGAVSLGQDPDSHSNHKASTFLSLEVAHKLIPIYRRMSDESLLQRMAHGGTQNNNESLNAMIWARCPKTSFMGLGRVKGSVVRAVSIFNAGANELINVMNKMHIDVSYVTLNNF